MGVGRTLLGSPSALPHTVEAQTGGGGRHLYFAHPDGELRNRVGLAPGLDLRGDGGLVVVPPSLHPSGGRYRWLPGHTPDETRPAPLPGWLLEIARGDAPRTGHPLPWWRSRVREMVPEGQRSDAIASFTG
ncbi:MAG: bifunctional DNA primase/polymerase, partial [Myxococcota bacterium]